MTSAVPAKKDARKEAVGESFLARIGKSTIDFGQPNPGGPLGGGGDVIALSKETVCTFLADSSVQD